VNRRSVFVLHVQPEPGVDAIRNLRGWLKQGLRTFGLRCLGIEEAQTQESDMAFNLRDTETQDSNTVPPGIYLLQTHVHKRGGFGDDHSLVLAKSQRTMMLELEHTIEMECKITNGKKAWDHEHVGRTLLDWITLELDAGDKPGVPPINAEQLRKYQTAVRMGRSRFRAMIDSALGVDPNDTSEQAWTRRESIKGYGGIEGMRFWAQLEIKPAANGYKARNFIDFIITSDMSDWPGMPKPAAAATPSAQALVPSFKSVADEMDDAVPFLLAFGVFLAGLISNAGSLIA
jgi:hypothetical protein